MRGPMRRRQDVAADLGALNLVGVRAPGLGGPVDLGGRGHSVDRGVSGHVAESMVGRWTWKSHLIYLACCDRPFGQEHC